jgi:hypothetical protein
MNMDSNSNNIPSMDIPTYTFVDAITLQNAFPVMARQVHRNKSEDQVDNVLADIASKEARKKGTKAWSELKGELNL